MKTKTEKIKIDCCAKVNLTLDVVSRRADGYHNVEMIMQEIGIKDVLTVEVSEGNSIVITCSDSRIPCDESNLAAKAARIFLDKLGSRAEVRIHIEKHIPSGAGLGGGSSDAAGVIRALNTLFGEPFSKDEMAELGAGIGADVPFFIYGGAMLARGIGTELKKIESLSCGIIVVAKPEFGVETAHVYKTLVLDNNTKHPDTASVLKAVRDGDVCVLAECGGNVLETVTAAEHGEIDEYKSIMKDGGADYVLMSGSGPSVFGVFADIGRAEETAAELRKYTSEVFVTEPVRR